MHTVSVEEVFRFGLGLLRMMRLARGDDWCRRRLVGPLRTLVQLPKHPKEVASISEGSEKLRQLFEGQFRTHCRDCGRCKLALA